MIRYELSAAWLLLPWLRRAQASTGAYQCVNLHQERNLLLLEGTAMASDLELITDLVDIWY